MSTATLQQQLDDRLKQAMRARDSQMLNLVRMLKARMIERKTAPGFKGEVDDALWTDVITVYAKSLSKALEQYRAVGPAGVEHATQLEWELRALDEWLPKKADAATVQGWIDEAIAGLGGKDNAKIGAVMGAVIKAHKADVDPGMVRQLAEQSLG